MTKLWQHAIGNYVPDFCSIKHRLIVELDGSQHLEQQEYDAERTRYLEARGYRVLRLVRYNENEMENQDG